jgi:hypothetical protein
MIPALHSVLILGTLVSAVVVDMHIDGCMLIYVVYVDM